MTELKKFFESFHNIDAMLENDIVEISVKQSKISMFFDDLSNITMEDLKKIDNYCKSISISSVTAFDSAIMVIFSNLSLDSFDDKDKESDLFTIYSFVNDLSEILCSCPALEFVVSGSYMKIFIDLPNISVKNLGKVDDFLDSDGILELNNNKPYVLYVKDWQNDL